MTFYGNEASTGGGLYCGYGACPTLTRTVIASSVQGGAIYCDGSSSPALVNCCVFGNAGGDSLCGSYHDNIFEDPLFCDAVNADFTLHADSPCLPENNPWGVLIGAHGLGCGLRIDAIVDFIPNVLNCRGHAPYVTCFIELPEEYDAADIDVGTVILNDLVPALLSPNSVGDHDENGIPDRMVKFNRSDVLVLLPVGEDVEVRVSGELIDGTAFTGADSIRVICKRPPIHVSALHEPDLRVSSAPGISSATITYALGAAGSVSLRVYDVSGRLVRTLVSGDQPAGQHEIAWDGRSDEGHRVGAGVYFIRLERGDGVSTAKTIVLR